MPAFKFRQKNSLFERERGHKARGYDATYELVDRHYTRESCPVLSPRFSAGTPNMSSKAKCRFIIGVVSG